MARNFQKSLMQSEWDGSKLTTGVFYDNGELAECYDGALVTLGELEDSTIYTGRKDPNVFAITAGDASKEIAVVDYVGVSNGSIMNVNYREGIKTYGLTAPAGTKVRVRRLCKHDFAYWSKDCFTVAAAPDAGKYAVADSTDGTKWAVQDSAATDKTCIKIHFAEPVTEGMVSNETQYYCEVINVI